MERQLGQRQQGGKKRDEEEREREMEGRENKNKKVELEKEERASDNTDMNYIDMSPHHPHPLLTSISHALYFSLPSHSIYAMPWSPHTFNY